MVRATRLIVLGTVLLAACSGGGGGGSGSGGSNDGSWLTISPGTATAVVFPNVATPVTLYATATRSFDQPVQVGIFDADGVTTGPLGLSVNGGGTQYAAAFYVARALTPGWHQGTLEVRICFDEPRACRSPLPGSPWHVGYRIFVVDPAAYTFQSWETATNPRFDLFALGTRGSDAVAVAVGFYSAATEVYTSPDGSSWTGVTTAHAPPATRGFALATVGTDLYLSGGERLGTYGNSLGTYTSHVWRFDGVDWHEQTAAAPFGARMGHAMVGFGGALYVLGGRNATAPFSDVWKSVDGGVTWTVVPGGKVPAANAWGICAVEWQGRLLVAGEGALLTSSDAAAWTAVPGYRWPFAIYATHCAVLNDRLYLYGPGGGPSGANRTVSSADLVTWQFEPGVSSGELEPGMVAVGGRLLLGDGVKTSQRFIFRSKP
jgi:hypothetical protein